MGTCNWDIRSIILHDEVVSIFYDNEGRAGLRGAVREGHRGLRGGHVAVPRQLHRRPEVPQLHLPAVLAAAVEPMRRPPASRGAAVTTRLGRGSLLPSATRRSGRPMTRDEIRDRLADIIRKETAYRGDVTDDMRLIEDIGADSLQLMAIVTSAETSFKVTISDEALFEIQRVGDAVDVVQAGLVRRRPERGAGLSSARPGAPTHDRRRAARTSGLVQLVDLGRVQPRELLPPQLERLRQLAADAELLEPQPHALHALVGREAPPVGADAGDERDVVRLARARPRSALRARPPCRPSLRPSSCRCAAAGRHEGRHVGPPGADHHRAVDPLAGAQLVLQVRRVDVLAVGQHHGVVQAAEHADAAVGVHAREVAGVEPARPRRSPRPSARGPCSSPA